MKYTASLCSYAHTSLWHLNQVKVPGSQQAARIRHCNVEQIDPQGLLLSFTTSELPLLGPAENAKILRQTNKPSNVVPVCLFFSSSNSYCLFEVQAVPVLHQIFKVILKSDYI